MISTFGHDYTTQREVIEMRFVFALKYLFFSFQMARFTHRGCNISDSWYYLAIKLIQVKLEKCLQRVYQTSQDRPLSILQSPGLKYCSPSYYRVIKLTKQLLSIFACSLERIFNLVVIIYQKQNYLLKF